MTSIVPTNPERAPGIRDEGGITTSPVDRATMARGLRLAIFSDTYGPQVNGVARTLERLTEAVRARGGTVRVFTTSDPGAPDDESVVRYRSVPFWGYPQLRLARPGVRRVMRALRDWSPTLVHAATPFGVGLAARSAARRLGVPFVTSYHTSFAAYAAFYRLGVLSTPGWHFLRWFHNSGLRTYCPTRAIEREIRDHGFTNTAVWSRGVDTQRFSPRFRGRALRERLGVSDDTFIVLYVGRIAAEKGLDVLLDAMARVNQERPGKVAFVIVGDGPYEEHCRRHAPPNAHFLGRMLGDELSATFASADLFAFPSTTDTFGNVLVESMASGVPVLGADVGPTRELLLPDRGELFRAGDGAALAHGILALADDPGRRDALAARSVAFAAACSWDRIFDELIMDYMQVVRVNAASGR